MEYFQYFGLFPFFVLLNFIILLIFILREAKHLDHLEDANQTGNNAGNKMRR